MSQQYNYYMHLSYVKGQQYITNNALYLRYDHDMESHN